MKFNKHQREIIKAINDGRVYDIFSFVTEFGYYKLYKNSKEKIQRLFDEQEKGKVYTIYAHSAANNDFEEPQEVSVPPELVYDVCYTITLNEEWNYEICSEDGIKIITLFDEIKTFIAIWEYLKSELQVIEVKKTMRKEEIGLFFQETKNDLFGKNTSEIDMDILPTNLYPSISFLHEHGLSKKATYKISVLRFLSQILECNEERIYVCEYYLDKKILPTPALDNFIKDDFATQEQMATRKSIKLAWVAIVISILTAIMSTFFSIIEMMTPDESTAYLKQIELEIEEVKEIISDKSK